LVRLFTPSFERSLTIKIIYDTKNNLLTVKSVFKIFCLVCTENAVNQKVKQTSRYMSKIM